MDFLAILVIVVAVALVYWFWIRNPNVVEPLKAEEPVAPYKVETPVEVASTTWPAATESVEIKVVEPTVVATAAPELKVVSSQPKKARAPRPRAKKPVTKTGTTAAAPKKPRQPKQ
jgi:hypothetical protein